MNEPTSGLRRLLAACALALAGATAITSCGSAPSQEALDSALTARPHDESGLTADPSTEASTQPVDLDSTGDEETTGRAASESGGSDAAPVGQVVGRRIVVPDRADESLRLAVRPPRSIDVPGVEMAIIEPAPTPTPVPTATPLPTPTPLVTPSALPAVAPTATSTPAPTPTPEPPPWCALWIKVPVDVLQFAHDSSEVPPTGRSWLESLAIELADARSIEIIGHASSDGDAAYNLTLSQYRADAVAAILRPLLPSTQIVTGGLGETDPIADNSTADGRAKNRRVEFTAEVPRATCDDLARG